jgi:hypothetical protein
MMIFLTGGWLKTQSKDYVAKGSGQKADVNHGKSNY